MFFNKEEISKPRIFYTDENKPGSHNKQKKRDTFADIGQSIAEHLDLAPLKTGKSFLS